MLQQALNRLPPADREIILLRHFGGLSFKELAKMLDCPIGTALARVHRGLAKLRQIMQQQVNGQDDTRNR